MVVGLFRVDGTDYYINVGSNKDKYTFNVIGYKNNKKVILSKTEVKSIFTEFFSSNNLSFYKEDGGYSVFFDELKNKRYFKNGKEDYFAFFKYNGCSAVLYSIPSISNFFNNSKMYVLNSGKKTLIIIGIVSMLCSFTACGFDDLHTSNDTSFEIASQAFETQEYTLEEVTPDWIVDKIQSETKILFYDNGTWQRKDADKQIKDFLCNKDFLNFIFSILDDNNKDNLRTKFSNFAIEYASDDMKATMGPFEGFWDPVLNCIVLKELDFGVLSHESVHIYESYEYRYICEALAVQVSSEFFGYTRINYASQLKRVQLLMEMVGPRPVLEAGFNGNISLLEKAIGNSLTDSEKKEFFELLRTPFDDRTIDMDEVDKKIDKFLLKIYNWKYGKSINNDPFMCYLFNFGPFTPNSRTYFNSNGANFYTPTKYRDFTIDKTKCTYKWNTDDGIMNGTYDELLDFLNHNGLDVIKGTVAGYIDDTMYYVSIKKNNDETFNIMVAKASEDEHPPISELYSDQVINNNISVITK